MAVESDLVTVDVVEASEFPDPARRHGARSVPRTIVNGERAVERAVPEAEFVEAVLAAAQKR